MAEATPYYYPLPQPLIEAVISLAMVLVLLALVSSVLREVRR